MNNFSLKSFYIYAPKIILICLRSKFCLLKSDIAAKVNIQIINAFVEMRKYIANNNYEERIKIKKY